MKLGDHLISPRRDYDHHGIYAGNQQVIHFAGPDKPNSKAIRKTKGRPSNHNTPSGLIVQTSLEAFSQGWVVTIKHHPKRVFDGQKALARARSQLGTGGYNMLFNNCEHFTNWCIHGIHSSQQVNNAVLGGVLLMGVMAGCA